MKRAEASPPSAANAGARSRSSRLPVAWLRMCSSSPICRPCAASPKTSTGPRCSSSRASAGPSSSRKKRSRSTASSSPTPNHSVWPGPSLSVEYARRSPSSTTQTGIDGEQTPVIGPTWSCSFPDSSAISPAASSRSASARSGAQPSNTAAASSARRCGSQTRSHSIGGPECSSSPSRSRGTTSPAGATVTARGLRGLDPLDRLARWRPRSARRARPTGASGPRASPGRRPPAAASRRRRPARPGRAARRRRSRARR